VIASAATALGMAETGVHSAATPAVMVASTGTVDGTGPAEASGSEPRLAAHSDMPAPPSKAAPMASDSCGRNTPWNSSVAADT